MTDDDLAGLGVGRGRRPRARPRRAAPMQICEPSGLEGRRYGCSRRQALGSPAAASRSASSRIIPCSMQSHSRPPPQGGDADRLDSRQGSSPSENTAPTVVRDSLKRTFPLSGRFLGVSAFPLSGRFGPSAFPLSGSPAFPLSGRFLDFGVRTGVRRGLR